MTYSRLEEIMLTGIQDPLLRESLSGLIGCYEAQGKPVEDAMSAIGDALKRTPSPTTTGEK